jgi:hypothetical protein
MTDTQLDTLEAKGLVKLAAYQPELEYLFRHVLVQDAAYGSLLKQERRELHRLVGETIEQLYAERGGQLAGILAMHFELAGDAAKAIEYLVADGQYAMERNALREAYSAFDRARALLAPVAADEPRDVLRRRVEIELGRARSAFAFSPSDQVLADLQAVVEPAELLGDLELIAQIHLYIALIQLEAGIKATEPSIQRSLKRVSEVGVELNDPSLGALPLALVGLNKVFLGPIREGVKALEEAIPLMEQRRDFIGAAFSRGWLAIGYAMLGDFDKAESAEQHADRGGCEWRPDCTARRRDRAGDDPLPARRARRCSAHRQGMCRALAGDRRDGLRRGERMGPRRRIPATGALRRSAGGAAAGSRSRAGERQRRPGLAANAAGLARDGAGNARRLGPG